MGVSEHKSVKIKLNNKTASGMYILISNDEIKYTKDNETKTPNRNYKIQVAVEVMYNHKRARGKETFNIRTGADLHRRATLYAKDHGVQLNKVVTDALEHYLNS